MTAIYHPSLWKDPSTLGYHPSPHFEENSSSKFFFERRGYVFGRPMWDDARMSWIPGLQL